MPDTGNYDRMGGGALIKSGGTVSNCIVAHNAALGDSASAYGGGVCIVDDGVLTHSIVVDNVASNRGGGIACIRGVINQPGLVRNCQVYQNTASPFFIWLSSQEGGGGLLSSTLTP